MLFNSTKETNRLRKEIGKLLNKGMSNIYLKVTIETFPKLRFSGFKTFVTRPVFREHVQLRQICLLQLENQVWEQNCVWLVYYFNFERNYDVLKSNSPCNLLNKNINFNESEIESKTEKPAYSFREANLVLQLI